MNPLRANQQVRSRDSSDDARRRDASQIEAPTFHHSCLRKSGVDSIWQNGVDERKTEECRRCSFRDDAVMPETETTGEISPDLDRS